MRSLASLSLIWILLLPDWCMGGEPIAELIPLTLPGSHESYTIAKIEVRSFEDDAGKKLARRLLKGAAKFVAMTYKKVYPSINPSVFEQMMGKAIPIDGHSSMIMIFRNDDPDDIVATLRLAYPDPDGKIPMESDLHWSYPNKALKKIPWFEFDVQQGKIRGLKQVGMRVAGGAIELKNLVRSENAPDDLVPVLFWAAEYSRLTQYHREIPESRIPEDRLAKLEIERPPPGKRVRFSVHTNEERARQYQDLGIGLTITRDPKSNSYLVEGMVPATRELHSDPLVPPTVLVSPADYALECYGPLVPYRYGVRPRPLGRVI